MYCRVLKVYLNLNILKRPDINEINLTLDEFDLMLNEYEIDYEQKGMKIKIKYF